MLCFMLASELLAVVEFESYDEMRNDPDEHVRPFTEAGTRTRFCKPQLLWSVLVWCSCQGDEVTKEDVAPETVAELGQC